MAIHYRDPKTGEYEVIKIPVMKGDQGHAGIHVGTETPPTTDIKLWFDPSDTNNDVDLANRLETTLTACYDYMGNDRGSIKDAADANVEYILGEVNTHHYEGQRITATDTIERQVKHAELQGRTLVNLCPNKVIDYMATSDWDGFNGLGQRSNTQNYSWKTLQDLRPNTKYFISCYVETFDVGKGEYYLFNNNNQSTVFNDTLTIYQTGLHKWVLTSKREFTEEVFVALRCQNAYARGAIKIKNIMIIEYQEGMENWDVPYFEGMKSVQAPSLVSVGKNLFDGIYEKLANKQFIRSTNFIRVKKGNNLVFSMSHSSGGHHACAFIVYDNNKKYVSTKESSQLLVEQDGYIKFQVYTTQSEWDLSTINWIQLEQGTQATPYEPYKSNISSTSENVVLRSLPDGTKDTLNLATGEYIQRIGEVIKDNANGFSLAVGGWETKANVCTFESFNPEGLRPQDATEHATLNCDKFSSLTFYTQWNNDKGIEGVTQHANGHIVLSIDRKKLTTQDLNGLNSYLKLNPITIQYRLETPIIKTIDLDNQKVYSYDGTTHYITASAENHPVPILSVDVPTNLPALVSKQRQQIEILEKENQVLSNELELAITSSEQNDRELLAQSFELDFRMMEVESALNLPMAATFQLGGKAMAMTPYDMAKKLILAGNYERSDMERKLDVYVSKKRMTEVERQELIQLMNEAEGIITVEPEAEEFVTEHEAVTIPLH